jgi:hypothetical protein
MPLPAGYTLDTPAPASNLPPGYTLDTPPPAPEKEGLWHSLGAQFGLTPEQLKARSDELAAHPVLESIPGIQNARALYNLVKESASQAKQAVTDYRGGNTPQAGIDAIQAVPILGPAIMKMVENSPATTPGQSYLSQVKADMTPGNLGTAIGAAAQVAPMILGAVDEAVPGRTVIANPTVPESIARLPKAVAQGVEAFNQATYPKNLSLTADQALGQSVVKALQPDAAAIPNVKSAAPELPDALAYAEKNGIPQNGKLDTANALLGRADEIQTHYDDAILKPNNTVVQTVPDNYDGSTVGPNRVGPPNRATLGQINDRVDAINSELKSNFRKKLSSQTTEANASDADLLAEKSGLTDILHTKLGELTGIDPADIADVRQRAGKLRSLAQEVIDSANKDTVSAGKRETSGPSFGLQSPVVAIQDAVGGGQEVIGNRVWKNAIADIAPVEKPLPQPKPPGPNVATTPEAAQGEFLRQHQLEQASQDAAAGRDQRVAGYRAARRALQQARTAWEGEAGRTIGQSRVRQAWAAKGAANLKQSGLSAGDMAKLHATPEGQQLLQRASSLPPNSAVIKNLIQQIGTK